MAVPVGKLGDAFESREITVKKMLDVIGRDSSDLTFTAALPDVAAALPDDPDVHIAWNALCEAYSDCVAMFRLATMWRKEIDVDGTTTAYLVPLEPSTTIMQANTNTFVDFFANGDLIAAVRVIQQPADLNLVWMGIQALTISEVTNYYAPLVDTITASATGFAGKGSATVEVSYWVAWENLTYTFRKYIFTAATRRFIQRAIGATDYIGFTQQDEQMALSRCQQEDLQISPCGIVSGSGSGERPNALILGIEDRNPY